MIKTLLALLLFVPTLLFGASIPFSGLQPDQFGSNVSTGKIWVKTGYVTTNANLRASTNHSTFTIDQAGAGYALVVQTNVLVVTNNMVGVGVSSLSYKFQVVDSSNDGITGRFQQTSASGSPFGVLVTAVGASAQNIAGAFIATGASANYGVFIDSTPAGANNYALYSPALAQSYFAGNVGIGTTTPASALDVAQTETAGNINVRTNLAVTNLSSALGGLKVGTSGSTITNIVSATAALNFGSILAAGFEDLTITVAGAKANDSVDPGPPADPDASLTFDYFVSAANTVTVRAHNVGTIAVDQASKTWRVTIQQF